MVGFSSYWAERGRKGVAGSGPGADAVRRARTRKSVQGARCSHIPLLRTAVGVTNRGGGAVLEKNMRGAVCRNARKKAKGEKGGGVAVQDQGGPERAVPGRMAASIHGVDTTRGLVRFSAGDGEIYAWQLRVAGCVGRFRGCGKGIRSAGDGANERGWGAVGRSRVSRANERGGVR